MNDDPGGRLSRWSRRKLAARRGEALEELPPANQPTPDIDTEKTSAQAIEAENVDVPKLPPIEELTRDSDYTVFLAKNVPETLRRAALQKLWRSDPVFANLDGLNDYCEDLNIVDTPITLAQTSYKVGRGFLDEIDKVLEKVASPKKSNSESDRSIEANSSGAIGADSVGDKIAAPMQEASDGRHGSEPVERREDAKEAD
jgi:hypothetical protein